MKKRFRGGIPFDQRRHYRRAWSVANQTAQSAPTPASPRPIRALATGCAGSTAMPAPLRKASPGAPLGHAASNAKRRISRCAARTRNCAAAELAAGVLARWLPQVERACASARRRARQRTLRSRCAAERPKARHQCEREGNRRCIEIDTGQFVCRFARQGSNIIDSMTRGGREALRDGRLVLLRQDRAASADDAQVRQEIFESCLTKVTVEQRGPIRAVVKLEGKHSTATAPGSRSRCAFTSMPAAMPCAYCTPSCSMATNRRTSSAALACAFQRR